MTRRARARFSALVLLVALTGCGGSAGSPVSGSAVALSSGTRERNVLFVTGLGNAVALFTADLHAKNPPSFARITRGITRAQGICMDKNGTLYVVNTASPSNIDEYKRGTFTPSKTITNGLSTPGFCATDSTATLYVSDDSGRGILVYPPGASSPKRTIWIPYENHAAIGGLAFDPKGNLLAATFNVRLGDSHVYSIAPGSNTAVDLNLQGVPGAALGVDAAGFIYAGGQGGGIAVYAPGAKTPVRTINAGTAGFYSDFAMRPDGAIYWPNYDTGEMFEFAPGASSPTNVFEGGGIDAAVGPW